MKISVVIPTFNRHDKLISCLRRLEEQTIPHSQFEVIVIDDGSTDGTREFLANYKEKTPLSLKFFVQENKGAGAARNKGVSHAVAPIILFIGDDIYASFDLLENHLKTHYEHKQENAGCLGYVTWDRTLEITPLMRFLESGTAILGRFGGGQFAYDLLKDTHTASWKFFYTANISLKKSVFEKHSFDETFKGYGWEDIDLGLRLFKKEKLTLYYNAKAIGFHHHPQTLESFKNREYSVGRGLHLFQKKHPDEQLLPRRLKKIIFTIISAAPFLPLWKILWKDLYFYALSKKYFLKGLKG